MKAFPDSSLDSQLQSALRALPDPQPSHGFDARMVDTLAAVPSHAMASPFVIAGAGTIAHRGPWARRSGWTVLAGLVFAVAVAVTSAAFIQSVVPMPTDLREPDTLSVLSYGVL